MRRGDLVAGFRRERSVVREQAFERPQHQRQGRAELMTDVGEEGRLGAVKLGKHIGPPSLILDCASVLNRRSYVARHQFKERLIFCIDAARRVDACNQDPERFVMNARHDGEDDSF